MPRPRVLNIELIKLLMPSCPNANRFTPPTAPNALNNLKAKFRAVFKKKDEKKAESKPAEASKPADKPAETTPATAAAATEPAKTETAPAGKSNQLNIHSAPASSDLIFVFY